MYHPPPRHLCRRRHRVVMTAAVVLVSHRHSIVDVLKRKGRERLIMMLMREENCLRSVFPLTTPHSVPITTTTTMKNGSNDVP